MSTKAFGDLVGSIDEGTSSARFALFKAGTAEIVCYHQSELSHVTPNEGWVEQDPVKILHIVKECIEKTIEKLIALGGQPSVSEKEIIPKKQWHKSLKLKRIHLFCRILWLLG